MTAARDDYPPGLSPGRWGHALNQMCASLADPDNRRLFHEDEGAYCDAYGLSPAEKKAILERDWIAMMEFGASMFSLDGQQ
jgi:protocatechuate 4,5-dioxygenase, alpha chain